MYKTKKKILRICPINKHVNTHYTMAQVHSALWCGKNQNHTHTHNTHFRNTRF